MNNYLTIKQAIDFTGKSDSTIRRAIKKAESNGVEVVMKAGNQLMIDKDWLNRTFDVSPVMDIDVSSRDIDMIKLQQQVISEQRNTIEHQQKHIDKLQDQVQDKSEKLELSFIKISDMERKLIEAKSDEMKSVIRNEDKRKAGVQDNIFIALLIIVVIGIIALGILA